MSKTEKKVKNANKYYLNSDIVIKQSPLQVKKINIQIKEIGKGSKPRRRKN